MDLFETKIPAKASDQIRAINPTEAARYRLIGLDYQSSKKFDKAIAAMQRSVELDPQNAAGKINLGWALHLSNRDAEAQKVLEKAVKEHPHNVSAYNALGIVYLVTGQLNKAVSAHKSAINLDNQDEIAYYNLSLSYNLLGNYEEAIEQGEKAALLEPHNPHPLIAIALNFWSKGNKIFSRNYFKRAVSLDDRYLNQQYLDNLKKAGFNPYQIKEVKMILKTL